MSRAKSIDAILSRLDGNTERIDLLSDKINRIAVRTADLEAQGQRLDPCRHRWSVQYEGPMPASRYCSRCNRTEIVRWEEGA